MLASIKHATREDLEAIVKQRSEWIAEAEKQRQARKRQ